MSPINGPHTTSYSFFTETTHLYCTILMYHIPSYPLLVICLQCFWHCWLGIRMSIWPVENQVMRYWRDHLSGAKCRWFAYGPADATATPSSLASFKSRMVSPFWCRLIQVVLEKRSLNWRVSVCHVWWCTSYLSEVPTCIWCPCWQWCHWNVTTFFFLAWNETYLLYSWLLFNQPTFHRYSRWGQVSQPVTSESVQKVKQH